MNDREIFRTNLVNLMKTAKVKQVDISKYMEVSYQTVSAWVKGRGYPRADAMEKLCRFFNVKQSALTEASPDMQEHNLLVKYRSLPDDGRTELVKRADELLILYGKRKAYGETETES